MPTHFFPTFSLSPLSRILDQFLERYILGDCIHSSPSCTVVEAEDVSNGGKVVVKLMANHHNFQREMKHAGLRDGNHIVKVLYSSTEHDAAKKAQHWGGAAANFGFKDMCHGIVMPRAQRNLMLIMKTERLDPDNGADDPNGDPSGVRRCFQELARALQFMQGNGVIHGDVKPLNCGASCLDCGAFPSSCSDVVPPPARARARARRPQCVLLSPCFIHRWVSPH